ncbi:unnamed protein product [Linum tenue]|uniref:Uncharacterized protein n=1 Tax=Linum tenue TaxID=586396 RepID=A0AAV0HW07_9ROSI|nr:unnamed protein product [Linum tenue]
MNLEHLNHLRDLPLSRILQPLRIQTLDHLGPELKPTLI